MILPVLSSPVFANPYLRPPVLAFGGEVPPCPGPNVILSEPAFSPLPLRALCELCVKNPRPSTPIVPFQPKPPRKVSTIAPLKSLPRVIHCTKTQIPVLCFQRVGHSSAITGEGEGPPYASPPDPTGENPRGCHPDRREGICFSFTSSISYTSFTSLFLSPSKSTLAKKHRVSPCLSRIRPLATSLVSTLTATSPANPVAATLTKKPGGGAPTRHRLHNPNWSTAPTGACIPFGPRV